MTEQKDWGNTKQNEKKEYLSEEDFVALKRQVRQGWLGLGMLHLRMENDVNLGLKKKISKQEIQKKLRQAAALLERMEAELERDGGK